MPRPSLLTVFPANRRRQFPTDRRFGPRRSSPQLFPMNRVFRWSCCEKALGRSQATRPYRLYTDTPHPPANPRTVRSIFTDGTRRRQTLRVTTPTLAQEPASGIAGRQETSAAFSIPSREPAGRPPTGRSDEKHIAPPATHPESTVGRKQASAPYYKDERLGLPAPILPRTPASVRRTDPRFFLVPDEDRARRTTDNRSHPKPPPPPQCVPDILLPPTPKRRTADCIRPKHPNQKIRETGRQHQLPPRFPDSFSPPPPRRAPNIGHTEHTRRFTDEPDRTIRSIGKNAVPPRRAPFRVPEETIRRSKAGSRRALSGLPPLHPVPSGRHGTRGYCAQRRTRLTIVCMARCIVSSEQYSNLPWKFIPPVKRFGHGRPI